MLSIVAVKVPPTGTLIWCDVSSSWDKWGLLDAAGALATWATRPPNKRTCRNARPLP